jgi:hypothetical protein
MDAKDTNALKRSTYSYSTTEMPSVLFLHDSGMIHTHQQE